MAEPLAQLAACLEARVEHVPDGGTTSPAQQYVRQALSNHDSQDLGGTIWQALSRGSGEQATSQASPSLARLTGSLKLPACSHRAQLLCHVPSH